MTPEKLSEAIGQIDDEIIKEADVLAEKNKNKRSVWVYIAPLAACCAITAAVFLTTNRGIVPDEDTGALTTDGAVSELTDTDGIAASKAYTVLAAAEYPDLRKPVFEVYNDWDSYNAALDAYKAKKEEFYSCTGSLPDFSDKFWSESMRVFLGTDGSQNAAFSPANAYMALAMVAETADGESRQQILDVLGAEGIGDLRENARMLWRNCFMSSELNETQLANSIWLSGGMEYSYDVMQNLTEYYYASAYSGNKADEEYLKLLQVWLNENTGGLLSDEVVGITFSPYSVFEIASTVYYKAQWVDKFNESNNTDGTFTKNDGTEQDAVFMNFSNDMYRYYDGNGYIATSLRIEEGDRMWLLLPDEGITPQQLVQNGEIYDFLYGGVKNKPLDCKIEFSMPKFDISSSGDLADGMKQLGITDIFDSNEADFTPIGAAADDGVYIGKMENAVRIAVDEEGVSAASYIYMEYDGEGIPDEVPLIRFTLDRPFIFVIESGNIPLFCGVVNSVE